MIAHVHLGRDHALDALSSFLFSGLITEALVEPLLAIGREELVTKSQALAPGLLHLNVGEYI